MSLDRLRGIHHVDKAARTVDLEAGITLEDLHPLLAGHGLALSNLGTISAQSFAGAMATATHGSGMGYGILSCHVEAVRMVDGRGKIHTFSRDEDPEFFGVGVHLGALGVITRVTVRCEPEFRLRLVQKRTSLEELEPQFRRFPTVTWLLAHSGTEDRETYVRVGRSHDNVFLETCNGFCPRGLIEYFVGQGLEDKLLWGSDTVFLNTSPQLGRVLFAKIAPEQKAKILGINARRIFKL